MNTKSSKKNEYDSLGQALKNKDFKILLSDLKGYSEESWEILKEHQHELPSELDKLLLYIPEFIINNDGSIDKEAFEVVNLILSNGANPNASFKNLITPFMMACTINNIDFVKCLLDSKYIKPNILQGDAGGNNSLYYAVRSESVDIIDLLIKEYNVDINKQYLLTNNKTMFHQACAEGLENSIKKLIELNVNPNLRDDYDNLACELIPCFDEEIHSPGDIPKSKLVLWDSLFELTKDYTESYTPEKSKKLSL